MITPEQLLPFLLTAVLLTATPGPDNLMVLSVGASKGRRLGMAFGLITNLILVGMVGLAPVRASANVHLVECFTTAASAIAG